MTITKICDRVNGITAGNKNVTIQLHYAVYYAGFQKKLTVQLNISLKSSSFNKKRGTNISFDFLLILKILN